MVHRLNSQTVAHDLLNHQVIQTINTEKGVTSNGELIGDLRFVEQAKVSSVFAFCDAKGEVAPRDGFEPPAKRLTVACSTAELPGNSTLPSVIQNGA
jgi:hypothetical protein